MSVRLTEELTHKLTHTTFNGLDAFRIEDGRFFFLTESALGKILPLIYSWGNEPCPHELRVRQGSEPFEPAKRHQCPKCWQSLKGDSQKEG